MGNWAKVSFISSPGLRSACIVILIIARCGINVLDRYPLHTLFYMVFGNSLTRRTYPLEAEYPPLRSDGGQWHLTSSALRTEWSGLPMSLRIVSHGLPSRKQRRTGPRHHSDMLQLYSFLDFDIKSSSGIAVQQHQAVNATVTELYQFSSSDMICNTSGTACICYLLLKIMTPRSAEQVRRVFQRKGCAQAEPSNASRPLSAAELSGLCSLRAQGRGP